MHATRALQGWLTAAWVANPRLPYQSTAYRHSRRSSIAKSKLNCTSFLCTADCLGLAASRKRDRSLRGCIAVLIARHQVHAWSEQQLGDRCERAGALVDPLR